MADLVNFLLTDLSAHGQDPSDHEYDKKIRRFANEIQNLPTQTLNQEIEGSSLLQLLDPARNTISFLHVLLAKPAKPVSNEILLAITDFFNSFDPVQIRYVGSDWRKLFDRLVGVFDDTHNVQNLAPLRTAILRMDPSSSTFTSNHLLFLQLCMETGNPRQALPILDKDIYSLPTDPISRVDETLPCSDHELSCAYITKSSGISAEIEVQEVQEYYLLGAHAYIGIRNYDRARLFLELAMSIPSQHHSVNPYMVEAYKKLQLVGLLAQGSPYKIAHLMDQPTMRTIEALSKPYLALVQAFEKRDLQKFHAEMDTGLDSWTQDGNGGLVNQVAISLRRYRIIDLQKTYAALNVDRVAIHLSLQTQSALTLLTDMIQDGHLNATLSQPSTSTTNGTSSPILRFHSQSSTTPSQTTTDIDSQIRAQIQQVEMLSTQVKEADRKLAVTREYTDWTRRNKKTDAGANSFEDSMDISWEPGNGGGDDEDIMGM